ncbi:MAG: porphobilinogen synthase [Phycisphaerales bacterium JB063]
MPDVPTNPPLDLPARPRRNRRSPAIRALVRETTLSASQLVYPLFVHDDADAPIDAMPGQTCWSPDGLIAEVGRASAVGIGSVLLFAKCPAKLKTPNGDEAANPDGLMQRAVRAVKQAHPAVCVMTDVALDPYNSDGHDGLVSDTGEVLNDASIQVLCAQAVSHAQAGADLVAPSDMMDGRVGAIREALDAAGCCNTGIMSYTAKYASSFYGPFRGALDSAPQASGNGKVIPGDKTTYQMDPANAREALRELDLDVEEGADIVLVKPAGPYLDVIHRLRAATDLPLAAYQVSGEYVMIKAAAAGGYLDERAVVLETLLGIRRAGADMILTYFAPQVAAWLKE